MQKKEFTKNVWPEVYASRQTKSILKWPVIGVEEHTLRFKDGEEKVLCLTVYENRVKGLIPFQESGVTPGPNKNATRGRLNQFLGQKIEFIVTRIDLENEQFLASRKAAMDRLSARTWPGLEIGQVKTCIARRVHDRYIIVEFDGIEATLPISEVSYGWVDDVKDFVQPGELFDVKIKELNPDDKKVVVSIKDLIPNPWPDAATRYTRNASYCATVTGITHYGIFVEIEPGVSALLNHHKSEIPNVGDEIAFVVTNIDTKINNGEVAGRIQGFPVKILRRVTS